MIIIIQHISVEGPGTLGDFLEKEGFILKICNLEQGDKFPERLEDIEAAIILGGPMNVYEVEKYPFLINEQVFINRIISQGIPLLGICLGAQLIAKTCGASVFKAPCKEIGWFPIKLSNTKNPLLKGLGTSLDVFQWHEDTFDLPHDGILLATAEGCHNQAFAINNHVFGLQFHIETTQDMIIDWIQEYSEHETQIDIEKFKTLTYNNISNNKEQYLKVYKNFKDIIQSRSRKFPNNEKLSTSRTGII